MAAQASIRHRKLGYATFSVLSLAVCCNVFLLQGRRFTPQVETSALPVQRSETPLVGEAGNETASDGAAPGVVALSPPQPAVRPLPVATAPAPISSRGEVVRAIQRGLGIQGYEPGNPDGIMGLLTQAAIMAYEFDNALPLTAEPSEELMRRIQQGPEPSAASQRKRPASVKTLEAATLIRNVGQWLAVIGYPVSKNETSMSPALVRAIRDYEASQKMPETGRISAPLVARLARAGQPRAAQR